MGPPIEPFHVALMLGEGIFIASKPLIWCYKDKGKLYLRTKQICWIGEGDIFNIVDPIGTKWRCHIELLYPECLTIISDNVIACDIGNIHEN